MHYLQSYYPFPFMADKYFCKYYHILILIIVVIYCLQKALIPKEIALNVKFKCCMLIYVALTHNAFLKDYLITKFSF